MKKRNTPPLAPHPPDKRRAVLAGSAVAVLLLAGGTAWFAWRGGRPIDTLRTDRVGAFGGTRGLTAALDRVAHDGLTLTRTYASAP